MPALPNVPQVVKCNLFWKVYGDAAAQTVLYFTYTGGAPSAANCSSTASGIVSAAETHFQSLTATTVVGMDEAMITDLSSATGGQGTGGTPWVGSRSGSPLPPATAVLVNHQINRRYRGGKPRSYLPLGTSADTASTGEWSSGFVSSVDTAWGAFISDVLALSAGISFTQFSNVSYYSGFTVVTNPTTGRARNVAKVRTVPIVDHVVSHTTNIKISSQRRRNRNS